MDTPAKNTHASFTETKESAKQLLLKGKFLASIGKYIEAYEILTSASETKETAQFPEQFNFKENRAIIKTNIGICYMKLGNYLDAVESCKQAYEICPTYEKSLYRMAVCYKAVGNYKEAGLTLQRMRTSMGDKSVQAMLKEVMQHL
jgi:tetratricopeptide (TPR) repeat protein